MVRRVPCLGLHCGGGGLVCRAAVCKHGHLYEDRGTCGHRALACRGHLSARQGAYVSGTGAAVPSSLVLGALKCSHCTCLLTETRLARSPSKSHQKGGR